MDWAADRQLNTAAREAGFVVVVRPDAATGQVIGSAYSQQHFTQDFTCVGPDVEHVVRELTQKLAAQGPTPSSAPPELPRKFSDAAGFKPRLTNHNGASDGAKHESSLPAKSAAAVRRHCAA